MANNFVWVNATTLNGTLWDNGTLSSATPITQIGTLTISGSSSKYLNTQLNNTGTIVENHASYRVLYFQDGAILNNSGNYELLEGTISNLNGVGTGTFNNSGTFKKTTTGTGTIGVAFNNTGTVNVESGTLNITGGGVSNGGNFNLTSGTTLAFSGTLNNGAKINGNGNLYVDGLLDVKLAGGTAIANTVQFTLRNGIFQVDGNWNLPTTNNWNGGTLKSSGIITNSGTLTISGSSSKYLNTQLNNTGTIV
ncbi:hypothetical protein MEO40_25625, partial [Dolichospermum sp. ST_sed1]|nr:hypothetical protein [Dolichospermum sp. ST_sed1]